jgi:hypothetical protein
MRRVREWSLTGCRGFIAYVVAGLNRGERRGLILAMGNIVWTARTCSRLKRLWNWNRCVEDRRVVEAGRKYLALRVLEGDAVFGLVGKAWNSARVGTMSLDPIPSNGSRS